jgi:hypothetical protein
MKSKSTKPSGSSGKPAFLIVEIKDFSVLVAEDGSQRLNINLTKDLPVMRTTLEKQAFHSRHANDHTAAEFVASLSKPGLHTYRGTSPFRWASAGYLPIFVIEGVRYCMLFLRNLRPVAGWNLANGASASREELVEVDKTAERELREEILVIDWSGEEERCLRLGFGGGMPPNNHHKKFLRVIKREARIATELVDGNVESTGPDHVEIRAPWLLGGLPYQTTKAFVILNAEKGENGIEFIKVIEWQLPQKLRHLEFHDAEIDEEPAAAGQASSRRAIRQAVGLFPLEELIRDFGASSQDPVPAPRYVFDRGHLLTGAILEGWLKDNELAAQWCPVARKTIRRYIGVMRRAANRFVRNPDDSWTITFAGRTSHFDPCVGFQHIVHLLRHAEKPVSCLDLWLATNSGDIPTDEAVQAAIDEGELHESDGADPDEADRMNAVMQVKRLRAELLEKRKPLMSARADAINRGDTGMLKDLDAQINLLDEEIRKCVVFLSAALDKWGRLRPPKGDPTERARSTVTKAIRRAIAVTRAKDTDLHEHLRTAIKATSWCSYHPATRTSWTF